MVLPRAICIWPTKYRNFEVKLVKNKRKKYSNNLNLIYNVYNLDHKYNYINIISISIHLIINNSYKNVNYRNDNCKLLLIILIICDLSIYEMAMIL